MPEANAMTSHQQDVDVWEGLDRFSDLPDWLKRARDPALVRAELSRIIPEVASGQVTILDCDPGHFVFKSEFWTGQFELTLSKPGAGEQWQSVLAGKVFSPHTTPAGEEVVEGAFGTQEWHAYLPDLHLDLRMQEADAALGALEMLSDPQSARAFLEENIRKDSPRYADIQILSCTPKVVRYKPGSRCTIVYRLAFPPDAGAGHNWPDLVVAKTYRADKGKNAYDSMAALWNSPLGSSQIVTIAEPLAYEPTLRALIQGPIREDFTLKELMEKAILSGDGETWAELDRLMRLTAVGLAELHQSGVQMGNPWSWENELDDVIRWIDRLSVPLPELATSIDPLVARLKALAADNPADALVPSHGSFRPAQVLVNQGKIGFIDFDSFGQCEPSLDLALFLGTVRNIATTTFPEGEGDWVDHPNRPIDLDVVERVDALCESFLEEYGRMHPFSRMRLALWETLDIFTYVIHCWTKIKIKELSGCVFLLDRYLDRNGIVKAS